MSSDNSDAGLFKDVRFYAIGSLEKQTKDLLESGGAKEESYLSGTATHAIVTDFDTVELEEAQDCWQIPTITERWVYLSSKCKKLLPYIFGFTIIMFGSLVAMSVCLFLKNISWTVWNRVPTYTIMTSTEAFTPSNTQLFSGMVVCPSQFAKADRDLLWGYVTFYGGSCQMVLNNKCTHLVVPKPEGAKYEEALKHPETITIVTPDWITDCVKSKNLEDAKNYHPSLVILPQPASVPDTPNTEPDVISSSLQSLSVTTGVDATVKTTEPITTISVTAKEATATPALTTSIPAPAPAPAPTAVPSVVNNNTLAQQTSVSRQQNMMVGMVTHMGQTITSQTGQQYLVTGQTTGKPQTVAMQQFPMQRPVAPGPNQARFSTPNVPQQRFQSPTNPQTTETRQATPTQKKPTKRRRSSAKSKANAKTANSSVPSAPMHNNQMTMITQQQFLQQQNQQMLMNQQHRMSMMPMQAGQPTKVNFMPQQQMYQTQHFPSNLQGKPQVPSTSPQKHQQHMIGGQTTMRPFMPGGFQQGNAMRMQQPHQVRQMQVQGQMTQQQMMAMGYNPQIQQQMAQQQMKMIVPGQQQASQLGPQQQQQAMMMPRGVQMQNQMQGMNPGKMQPQRMQVSPQQQAMLVQQQQQQQHASKDGLSPQQQPIPPQQQSPHKQPQQPQMIPQQRQHMHMHQRQMQMQQQQQHMVQTQGLAPQAQQKLVSSSAAHAPMNTGMDAISPTALQQGLMMARQTSSFQPPLIHPSLQTPQDYGKVNSQGGTTKSRRSKSRKTKDGDENVDGKTKTKSRSRPKKSSQSPASTSSPGNKKLSQASPAMGNVGGFYPTPMNVMTPPPHPTVPVDFTGSKPAFAAPTVTASPLAATENTFGQMQHVVSRPSPEIETRFLPQHEPTPTPPPPPRGPFIDPLEVVPKSFEGKYFGHDPAENGCVFVIAEYQNTVPDLKVIEHWKKVINKFGGIVEEEYNTCTCTHVLCISQATTLFKDALLEGKRCVTVYWLNDVLQIRKLRPPWLAIHIPTTFSSSQKPASKHTISYTGFHQKERERLIMMASVCGCTFSGFLGRSNTVLICKGTSSLKYDKAREWKIPCVNVHWLRDILHGDTAAISEPGQSKYQNFDENSPDLFSLDESKVQKILDPWKVPVRVTLDCMQRARVKRKNSAGDGNTPAMKRSRTDGSYQPLPRVCFTGLPLKQVTDLQKTLESLQGQASKSVSMSTHLVAERVSRTVKFLCAVSVCQYIVTPEWIEESAKSNWLLDEDKYLLNDKVAEERFDFSLKESLKKARARPLFKGYVFCITESVVPDKKILTEIVECAGGKVIQKIPTTAVLKKLKSRKPPNNHLLLVSCPTDEHLVIKWKQEGIPVHNAEIILSGVLKQEVNETSYQL